MPQDRLGGAPGNQGDRPLIEHGGVPQSAYGRHAREARTSSAVEVKAGSDQRHRAAAARCDELAVRQEVTALVTVLNKWL
ncbi:hypothetical protein DT019_20970 [Streptomyces sp. SDr-06]|nr:hypothetical protein DT019_20970 [Streptomyces sp. SDr-06]